MLKEMELSSSVTHGAEKTKPPRARLRFPYSRNTARAGSQPGCKWRITCSWERRYPKDVWLHSLHSGIVESEGHLGDALPWRKENTHRFLDSYVYGHAWGQGFLGNDREPMREPCGSIQFQYEPISNHMNTVQFQFDEFHERKYPGAGPAPGAWAGLGPGHLFRLSQTDVGSSSPSLHLVQDPPRIV